MILDELLFKELQNIGDEIIKDSNLLKRPSNSYEMNLFWKQFEQGLKDNKMYSVLLGNILFHFITNKEIRDRQTNSRIFEDIFSGLFGSISTDSTVRTNPIVCEDVAYYDVYENTNNNYISNAMSGNKREKCDLLIDNYGISLKTLKGPIYNKSGKIVDSSQNTELNVGSFNYNALLSDVIPDSKLNELSDRTSGLGSGRQLREHVFDVIKENNNQNKFFLKLSALFKYVYGDEDIYIILKSHYNIIFIFIPADSFTKAVLSKYKDEEETFQQIWYRWENNNLRFNWVHLLKYMDKQNIQYYKNNISLSKAISNEKYNEFISLMQKSIDENIALLIKKD